eukprot:jgi/Orpsp1_1/1188841/evm.model.d7180000067647.1
MNIGENISKGIKESKWIYVEYINRNNIKTRFWMSVKDINIESRTLYIYMFKYNKKEDFDTRESWIKFDNIVYAEVLEYTSYQTPDELIEKIEKNIEKCEWLKYDRFSYNILNYYMDCNRLDCDPEQKEFTLVDGIDIYILKRDSKFPLSDYQIKTLIEEVYLKDLKKINSKFSTLIINKLSIDKGSKKYVVCYYELLFDPRERSLVIDTTLHFNSGFMVEGRRNSIFKYINMDREVFEKNFETNYDEYYGMINENLRYGEVINTRPDIMLLERGFDVDLYSTFSVIEEKYNKKQLPVPLKSFFGNISKRNMANRKEPSLVIYDERINVSQMRVLYNSLKYPVTFVKGPPGTGKTQTILNIIMSGFYNDKTMLICSSNNKPVDGLLEKLNLTYNGKDIPFPYIRLGNNAILGEATKKIKEFYEMATDDKITNETLKALKFCDGEQHKELIRISNIQERRAELQNYIKCSEVLIQKFGKEKSHIIDKIKEKVTTIKMELTKLPEITNEDLLKLFVPFNKNELAMKYFYYRSLHYINKLRKPRYNELIFICSIKDVETRVKEFNKWCTYDDNMKKLTKVFPIIFSTNISTQKLGSPMFMFDMVVMDEAGQCNVAQALIPITKAKSLVLIGDPQQLKPVIVMDKSSNEALMEKYHVSEKYNYMTHSILEVMVSNDNISKYILLKYHYRCGRKIINFPNQRYYNKDLDLSYVTKEGDVEMIDVKSNKKNTNMNESVDEAEAIVEYIKRNKIHDASIVTPFVNQQVLISKMLAKERIRDVHCGTIHSLQGAEKDTVIFSLAISTKTRKRTYDWIKDNSELINVAVTRAKNKLVVVGDKEVIKCISKDEEDDVSNLIKYVNNNGNTVVPPNESTRYEIGHSNGSKAEDKFFVTIKHFCSCYRKFKAERNVMLSKIINIRSIQFPTTDLEFDLILYALIGNTPKPVIAFEINGGEHLGTIARERSDKKKMTICKENNIKLVFIPNSFVKDYENIMDIILSFKS